MKAFAESGDQVLKRGMQSGELLGHDYVALTVNQNQERSSSQTSYGNLAFRETSLTVYVRTLAKKILFDNRKTVTGVQVETGGLHYNIHARREVILSAGAIQSPQLLLVSGVGPAEVLKKHKIPVIHDLPGVGQNFQYVILIQCGVLLMFKATTRCSDIRLASTSKQLSHTS